jgi:hypothetical protein
MNRRGFIGSILALGAAPAIVRADSLMRIVPRETLVAANLTSEKIIELALECLPDGLASGANFSKVLLDRYTLADFYRGYEIRGDTLIEIPAPERYQQRPR